MFTDMGYTFLTAVGCNFLKLTVLSQLLKEPPISFLFISVKWLRMDPADPAHLFSSFHTQREVLQDQVQALSVSNAVVAELHISLHWPVRLGLPVLDRSPTGPGKTNAAFPSLFLNNSLTLLGVQQH